MQEASVEGLRPAPAERRRCTVMPILQATEVMASELIRMWAGALWRPGGLGVLSHRSPGWSLTCFRLPNQAEAWTRRSRRSRARTSPLTNQSDKELQLYKLRELDSLVREAVAECEVSPRLERLTG